VQESLLIQHRIRLSDCHNTVCDTIAASVRASRKLSVKARKLRLDSENVLPVKRERERESRFLTAHQHKNSVPFEVKKKQMGKSGELREIINNV